MTIYVPEMFNPVQLTYAFCESAAVIHATGFDYPWKKEAFESLLVLPSTVAWIDSNGLLVCSKICDEMEILTICVAADKRRQGYGFLWMQFLKQYAQTNGIKRIFLEVSTENIGAKKLYQKCGFKEIGIRKGYYKTKTGFCDAVCMEKEI